MDRCLFRSNDLSERDPLCVSESPKRRPPRSARAALGWRDRSGPERIFARSADECRQRRSECPASEARHRQKGRLQVGREMQGARLVRLSASVTVFPVLILGSKRATPTNRRRPLAGQTDGRRTTYAVQWKCL
jgi:hypothetical protein